MPKKKNSIKYFPGDSIVAKDPIASTIDIIYAGKLAKLEPLLF
jgi:hypothetical protein